MHNISKRAKRSDARERCKGVGVRGIKHMDGVIRSMYRDTSVEERVTRACEWSDQSLGSKCKIRGQNDHNRGMMTTAGM